MSLKKILPYILATLLLGFLLGMVQSPQVLLKGKEEATKQQPPNDGVAASRTSDLAI